ncbi:MAG: CheR family methyltransferase [Desulfomonilia bacterium]
MLPVSLDISDKEFILFKELIHRETGIHMSDKKRKLIVARLSKRLRSLELENFTQYYEYLRENPNAGGEIVHLINRITTNKTDFFRERYHFVFLQEHVFPEKIRECRRTGNRQLRIWSAGCSSGEEPYSIAMTVAETFRNEKGWDIKVLATDLDTEVLEKASTGIYPTQVLAPVPREYLSRYFNRKPNGYEVCREIKSLVTFRKLNLMEPLFPMRRPFDIIFCRNVIIYFNEETKRSLFRKFHAHLKDMGFMFIGHSESLMQMRENFQYLKHTIYQKV